MGKITDNIVTVNIDLSTPTVGYKTKWLVAFNHDWMIETINRLGGEDYLEENQIFAICFDTTPVDQIKAMRDYKEVLDCFPKSNRVCSQSIYIGNYEKKDWLEIVNKTLSNFSRLPYRIWQEPPPDPLPYEIVYIEDEFTKTKEESK